MPVTFPAHQGLIAAAKLRWPQRIDGTALCIGAAAPDFAYAMGPWLNTQSHTAIGLVIWAVPFTVAATALTRWRSAAGTFAHLPDLGPLRLRSYRVLSLRRPSAIVTISSACAGAASHIVIDGFTHRGRWGSDLLGLNRIVATLPVIDQLSVAKVAQYFGHTVGSLLFLWLVFAIATTNALERWYGPAAVTAARRRRPSGSERAWFWLLVTGPTVAAAAVAPAIDRPRLFLTIAVGAMALLVAGAVVPSGSLLAPASGLRCEPGTPARGPKGASDGVSEVCKG